MNATIEIDGLRKRFGPVQALDGMTFTVSLWLAHSQGLKAGRVDEVIAAGRPPT